MELIKCVRCSVEFEWFNKYKKPIKYWPSICINCRRKGSANGNWKGKSINKPENKEKYLKAVKLRGQSWTEKHKENHSILMKTDTNWMKNKKHTEETKQYISKKKIEQYRNGEIKIKYNLKSIKISKAEKEIEEYLKFLNINYVTQYRLDDITYIYDFYIEKLNLIIEYNGDYWHANPKKYKHDDVLKFPRKQFKKASDIWYRDSIKKKLIEEKGYNFVYIWEKDYKEQKFELIKKILKL